jgi:histidyl-tRNA synthetase
MGMERLVLLLAQVDQTGSTASAPDLYVVNRGPAAEAAALVLARGLRGQGLRVDLDPGGSAFGKQFKRADRSGAPWAAVLGDDELAQGVVVLQPLRGQVAGEHRMELNDLPALIARLRP